MQALREACKHVSRSAVLRCRTYKGLPTHTSPYVEAWYNAREDMEMKATITGPMLASGFLWGCVIPYLTYELVVAELRDSEKDSGKEFTLLPQSVDFDTPRQPEHDGDEG